MLVWHSNCRQTHRHTMNPTWLQSSANPSTNASTNETSDSSISISFTTKPCDDKQTSGISYDESATAFGYSLGILKESLVNEIQLRASEATIDAFKQEGQGCRYTIHMLYRFRNPVHHYVARRIVARSIGTQKTFRLVSTNGSESTGKPRPKIGSKPIDAVHQSYI